MIKTLFASRFIRFALVGGGATALQYLLLVAFVELELMGAVAGSALAFTVSALGNYWLNYHFTFASNKQHRETLPKFAATAALGLAINTASFALLLLVAAHYLLAQLGATAITLIANFLLHKHWIYRSHHDPNNSFTGDSCSLLQRRGSHREDAG